MYDADKVLGAYAHDDCKCIGTLPLASGAASIHTLTKHVIQHNQWGGIAYMSNGTISRIDRKRIRYTS